VGGDLGCGLSSDHTATHLPVPVTEKGFLLSEINHMHTGDVYILGYLLELIIKIWQFANLFFSKSGKFGPLFFMENPLYTSKSYLSSRNFAKFLNLKKKLKIIIFKKKKPLYLVH